MNYKIFVGIDVSKNFFSACAIDSQQNILFQITLPMDKHGFKTLTKKLKNYPKYSILIGKESSGCYHINLFAFLSNKNFHCVLLNPLLVSNFIKLNLRKTKTDKADAKSIALLLSLLHEKLPKQAFLPQEFKELARERESLVQRSAQLKNDIEKLCVVFFPELERKVNIYSTTILKLLEKFPSAKAISNLPIETLSKLLKPSSKGRNVNISPYELKTLAKNSIAQKFPVKELILSRKIKELFFVEENIKQINKLLREICENSSQKQNVEILKYIKGIGESSAIHFIAEVGDIKKFSNAKKLIAYCGLDPTVYQSGNYQGKSKISKRGNRHLRRIIWLMTVSVVRFNAYFRDYFLRRRKEGLPYKKAILATSHKLIRTIYAMLTKKTYFHVPCPSLSPNLTFNSQKKIFYNFIS